MGESLIVVASGDALTCPRCGTHHAPEHRFCGNCGAELTPLSPAPSASAEIDRLAGAPYVPGPERHPAAGAPSRPEYAGQADDAIPYYIPPARIVALTLLSSGLYLFFWMYVTWRQYRDHTGQIAYPVMHALAMLVPIYQFFRLHAHIRVYQEMMEQRGVPTTLNPPRAVLIYFGVVLLGMVSLVIPSGGPVTPTQQAAYLAIIVGQAALLSWIMWQVQTNLNRFWQHRLGVRLGWMRLSVAELVLVAVGFLLGWGMLLIVLVDPSLLPTEGAGGTRTG